jgi:hypothetical protein
LEFSWKVLINDSNSNIISFGVKFENNRKLARPRKGEGRKHVWREKRGQTRKEVRGRKRSKKSIYRRNYRWITIIKKEKIFGTNSMF